MSNVYNIDPTISYDVVELPSKGIYYPDKRKTLRIAYLTAYDENILTSQNLIQTNKVIDELLRRKVLDKEMLIEDIVEQDRQAILIFLRNTAFGSEYFLTLTDPKTGEKFKYTADLSVVKTKDFDLTEDENGEYHYFLEKSKVDISFKFLTQKQEDELEKIKTSWSGTGIAPIKSKKLEFMIKSVNGNRDQMQIHSFIEKMPIKDSFDFQNFVDEKKPGLDLTIKVKAPSGEEIQTFLGFGAEFFRPFYGA